MMKLRAKQFKADTSIFHLMMSGCSVHVFCFKGESMMSGWRNEIKRCLYFGGTGRRLHHDLDRQFGTILPKMGMKRCVSKSQAFAS
jgi:hypothetical protein